MRRLALILLLAGCQSALVATPPQPEDEVARLGREITKVRFAIESTRKLIEESRGESYLPDLYMRLAELNIEEAKYHYLIAYEGQKRRNKTVDAVQPRLLKNRAIGIFKRILDEYPEYEANDKVRYFIAHEYRELGEYPTMISYLKEVIELHPKSAFRNEALLVLGDYYFDRSELEVSGKYYETILEGPESTSHAMARYKLAWVRINEENMKDALRLFEDAVKGMAESKDIVPSSVAQKLDLKREVVVDMVYPYADVHPEATSKQSLEYFRKNADSRTTYLSALSKLAKRRFVKSQYNVASGIYREILKHGVDDEESTEWARRLYDGVKKRNLYEHVATDVRILARLASRRQHDTRLPPEARQKLFDEFEIYARDLATRAQILAKEKNAPNLYRRAGNAYDAYLAVFGRSRSAIEIKRNLADSRFLATQWFKAGRAYDELVRTASTTPEKKALESSVASYAKALEKPWKLTRVDRAQARASLKASARKFIQQYPKDPAVAAVKFNLAKGYYDEGEFATSSELFVALVDEFPSSKEAEVAAELALDSLRAHEDFEEMARVGQRLANDSRLSPKVRAEIAQIVRGAESRALESTTLEAGYKGQESNAALLDFAQRHPNSQLGEKALINAFVTAQNNDDLEQIEKIGKQLFAEYPKSEAIPEVLGTLGRMSAQIGDFSHASEYFDQAASGATDPASKSALYRSVALMRAHLGELSGARKAYSAALNLAKDPADRREFALQYADVMEQAGNYAEVAIAIALAIDTGERSPNLLFRLGYARLKIGDKRSAQIVFQSAAQGSAKSPEDIDGAAGAAYFLAEPVYENYLAVKFNGPAAEGIQRKFDALSKVEDAMLKVIDLGSPRFALVALARLADAYADGAAFLENGPVPAGLDGEGAKRFRAALSARAGELTKKRTEALDTCSSKATELKIFVPAVRTCLKGAPLEGDPIRPGPVVLSKSASRANVAELRKRLAKNSKDYQALAQLAESHLAAGESLVAKLVLEKASEGGASAMIYNLRGVAFYALGYPQAAFESFSKALETDGTYRDAHMNLSTLYRGYGYSTLADAERSKVGGTAPSGPAVLPEAVR